MKRKALPAVMQRPQLIGESCSISSKNTLQGAHLEMKLLYITCSVSLQEQVESMLRAFHPASFQVIPKVLSESQLAEPRKDDAVWPGYDVAFMVQATDEEAEQIFAALRTHNETAYNREETIEGTMLDVVSRLE